MENQRRTKIKAGTFIIPSDTRSIQMLEDYNRAIESGKPKDEALAEASKVVHPTNRLLQELKREVAAKKEKKADGENKTTDDVGNGEGETAKDGALDTDHQTPEVAPLRNHNTQRPLEQRLQPAEKGTTRTINTNTGRSIKQKSPMRHNAKRARAGKAYDENVHPNPWMAGTRVDEMNEGGGDEIGESPPKKRECINLCDSDDE